MHLHNADRGTGLASDSQCEWKCLFGKGRAVERNEE
jgi:hypothetical protein